MPRDQRHVRRVRQEIGWSAPDQPVHLFGDRQAKVERRPAAGDERHGAWRTPVRQGPPMFGIGAWVSVAAQHRDIGGNVQTDPQHETQRGCRTVEQRQLGTGRFKWRAGRPGGANLADATMRLRRRGRVQPPSAFLHILPREQRQAPPPLHRQFAIRRSTQRAQPIPIERHSTMAEIQQRLELCQLMRLQRVRRPILRAVELELQRQQLGSGRARKARPGHPGDDGCDLQRR